MRRNAYDKAANFSGQVTELQDIFLYNTPAGVPVRFECLLTGNHGKFIRMYLFFLYKKKINHAIDGKFLQMANHLEGFKCWVCPEDTASTEEMCESGAVRHSQFFFSTTYINNEVMDVMDKCLFVMDGIDGFLKQKKS